MLNRPVLPALFAGASILTYPLAPKISSVSDSEDLKLRFKPPDRVRDIGKISPGGNKKPSPPGFRQPKIPPSPTPPSIPPGQDHPPKPISPIPPPPIIPGYPLPPWTPPNLPPIDPKYKCEDKNDCGKDVPPSKPNPTPQLVATNIEIPTDLLRFLPPNRNPYNIQYNFTPQAEKDLNDFGDSVKKDAQNIKTPEFDHSYIDKEYVDKTATKIIDSIPEGGKDQFRTERCKSTNPKRAEECPLQIGPGGSEYGIDGTEDSQGTVDSGVGSSPDFNPPNTPRFEPPPNTPLIKNKIPKVALEYLSKIPREDLQKIKDILEGGYDILPDSPKHNQTPYKEQADKLTARLRKLLLGDNLAFDSHLQKKIFFSHPNPEDKFETVSLYEVYEYEDLSPEKKATVDFFFSIQKEHVGHNNGNGYAPKDGHPLGGSYEHYKNLDLEHFYNKSLAQSLYGTLGDIMPFYSWTMYNNSLTSNGPGSGDKIWLPDSMQPTFPRVDKFGGQLFSAKKTLAESFFDQLTDTARKDTTLIVDEDLEKAEIIIDLPEGLSDTSLEEKGDMLDNSLFHDNLREIFWFKQHLNFVPGFAYICDGAGLNNLKVLAVTDSSLLNLRMGIVGKYANDEFRIYYNTNQVSYSTGYWRLAHYIASPAKLIGNPIAYKVRGVDEQLHRIDNHYDFSRETFFCPKSCGYSIFDDYTSIDRITRKEISHLFDALRNYLKKFPAIKDYKRFLLLSVFTDHLLLLANEDISKTPSLSQDIIKIPIKANSERDVAILEHQKSIAKKYLDKLKSIQNQSGKEAETIKKGFNTLQDAQFEFHAFMGFEY